MPVGVLLKKAVNPIRKTVERSIAECVGFADPTGQYVGVSDIIGEMTQSSEGSIAGSSSSSAIAECDAIDVWSNQQWSSSSVNGECIVTEAKIGTIDIYDEGNLVQSDVSCIDFTGDSVEATKGIGACVEVEVFATGPPPIYISHFNTEDGSNDALVNDVPTTIRYIATPSGGEGSPFYTNGWAGSEHPATRDAVLSWQTNGPCSFVHDNTTFHVLIENGNGDVVVDSFSAPIIGDGVYPVSTDWEVTISNWTDDHDKHFANVEISVDIKSILPSSGYFDITITHRDDIDGDFIKTQ